MRQKKYDNVIVNNLSMAQDIALHDILKTSLGIPTENITMKVPTNFYEGGADQGAEDHIESRAPPYKPVTEQKPIDLTLKRAALPSDDDALKPFAGTAILWVDDNETNREIARGIINDLGLECVTAVNGSDALSKLESYTKDSNFKDFGAVLMDCQMPVMDGLTASEKTGNHVAGALNARIPKVAITANAMSEAKSLRIKSDMNGYRSKPIDAAEPKTTPVDTLTEYTVRQTSTG
ncbi:MAG: CheY-like chemotaxis protein [Candidatus Azotimanducaceae bacterium]